jgi:hypothetical protein
VGRMGKNNCKTSPNRAEVEDYSKVNIFHNSNLSF